MGGDTFEFEYNGLGDRLRQTVNGAPIDYSLDLAAGLTQVLSDGTTRTSTAAGVSASSSRMDGSITWAMRWGALDRSSPPLPRWR